MALKTFPTMREMTSDQLLASIEAKRGRRISAAIAFHQGRNAKFEKISDKMQARIDRKLDVLGKDLKRCDDLLNKIEAAVQEIDNLRNQKGTAQSMIIQFNKGEDEDE